MINTEKYKNTITIVSNEPITVNAINAGRDALMEIKGDVSIVKQLHPYPLKNNKVVIKDIKRE